MSKLPMSAGTVPCPLSVETLLRNLRLLDLDDEFDWPAITSATFAADDGGQNQKRRIRAAEWVIYKLFEIWDPEGTKSVHTILSLCGCGEPN